MFHLFPHINYKGKDVDDIFKRWIPRFNTKASYDQFIPHKIKDGERPDTLANLHYGHPKYAWVILAVNRMSWSDWPLTHDQLELVIQREYGDRRYEVHHFETKPNLVDDVEVYQIEQINALTGETEFLPVLAAYVHETDGTYTTIQGTEQVLVGEWLENENDKKRDILILRPEHLNTFIRSVSDALSL